MMSQRDAVKIIVRFAKKEFLEKRPKEVQVLRIKSKAILTRGLLPTLQIRQIKNTFIIIVADYGEELRIYSFGRNGELLGGENFDKNPKFLKNLEKSTKLIYHLPKKKVELTLDDISNHYREEFEKILKSINAAFGISIIIPFNVIADDKFDIIPERTFGTRKDDNFLRISASAYKKDMFKLIAMKEIFFEFLNDTVQLTQSKEGLEIFYHDLAILLTNMYLANKHNEFFKEVINCCEMEFKIYFTGVVRETLDGLRGILPQKTSNIIIKNLIVLFNILKHYSIKLDMLEFSTLFLEINNLFSQNSPVDIYYPCEKEDLYRLLLSVFERSVAISRSSTSSEGLDAESNTDEEGDELISKKRELLVLSFEILSNSHLQEMEFNYFIEKIEKITEQESIKSVIGNVQNLLEDILKQYLVIQVIKIKHELTRNEYLIEFKLSINNLNVIERLNAVVNLTWKPHNRVVLQGSNENTIENKTVKDFSLILVSTGKVTFFCELIHDNYFNKNRKIKQTIKLTTQRFE